MIRYAFVLLAIIPLACDTRVGQGQKPRGEVVDPEKIQALYGMVVDPDQECRFNLDGDRLTITMPGGKRYDHNEKVPDGGKAFDNREVKTNCPRVLREVEGDFVVTVRTRVVLPKGAKPVDGTIPEVGAGIMVEDNATGGWRSGLHGTVRADERYMTVVPPKSQGVGGQIYEESRVADGLFIRFTRLGSDMRWEVSVDGKKWESPTLTTTKLADRLKVGVYGVSNTMADTTVMFEKFEVKPIEKN